MPTTLKDAFVEDHRKLTRGLSRLVALVEQKKYREARSLAEELDAIAGPHIEFEEKSFYPEVRKARGDDYVDNLYDEHRAGLEAVRTLSRLGKDEGLTPRAHDRVLFDLNRALRHAVSCGTLLSHVTCLGEDEQQRFLAELEHYRALAHKWTELHPLEERNLPVSAQGEQG